MIDDLFFAENGKSLRKGNRASKRRDIERKVHLHRIDDDGRDLDAGAQAEGVAVNISLEGMFIQTGEPYDVGDKLMIDVKRGKDLDAPSFMYVRGQVVRRVPMGDDVWGLGVRMMGKERKALEATEAAG